MLLAIVGVLSGPRSTLAGISDGAAWEPAPQSRPLYAIADPQQAFVEAADGVTLEVEAWLPAAKDGNVPPAHLPAVLLITAYKAGEETALVRPPPALSYLVPRGYAFVWAAARGYGSSGGCYNLLSKQAADDGSRLVEWAGSQPWSNGRVALIGLSDSANHAWLTALSGNPDRLRFLEAVVAIDGFAGGYDAVFMDGAPAPIRNTGASAAFVALGARVGDPEHAPQRACAIETWSHSTDWSGAFTPFWQAREHRGGVSQFRTPVLIAHGIHDLNVLPRPYMGLLDHIPADVPVKTVLGQWRHNYPDIGDGNPEWARADWWPMVTAWLDRWLKGLPTGVESWPNVQVADSRGQWRAESAWIGTPRTGALALSAAGVLGAADPTGETTYVQAEADAVRRSVNFVTPPMADDLRIYGGAELDLWVKVSDPRANVGVQLTVVDEAGETRRLPYAEVIGGRSMRYLHPIVGGRFAQTQGFDPPLDTPIHTTIRLNPSDILVPKGWRLQLTFTSLVGSRDPVRLSGGVPYPPETMGADGATGQITILHSCDRPTVLRFAMANPDAPLLNVREPHETGPLAGTPASGPLSVDGGGIAHAPICAAG